MRLRALFRLAFARVPAVAALTTPHRLTRWLILQKARHQRLAPPLTVCKHTVSESVSLPSPGFFSPFPHGTCALSVVKCIQPWRVDPPSSGGVSVSRRTLCQSGWATFVYEAFTPSGRSFQTLRLLARPPLLWRAAPLSLATTRGIVSVPQGTQMFQFPWFPSRWLCVHQRTLWHAPQWVSPFGHLRLKRLHTPPRSFSQCTASFIGTRRLVIPLALW